MNKYGIQHVPDSGYAYPLNANTLRLVLKTARGEKFKEVAVLWNNKYEFTRRRRFTRMRLLCSDAFYDYHVCDLTSADVRFAYIFLLTLPGGEEYYFSEEGLTREYDFKHGYYTFFQYPFINGADIIRAVSWAEEAAVYQIFVDRFRRGDMEKDDTYITQAWAQVPAAKDFAGGDLKGITEKLDVICGMGFDTIYLTPVFQSPSNHKYNITNYLAVDGMFGGDEALRELIGATHARGMRLILDAVFNHCDESNPLFADVKAKGRASEFYDWFIVHGDTPVLGSPLRGRQDPGAGTPQGVGKASEVDEGASRALCNYEIFADCPYMPKWNTSNPAVQDYLIGIALDYLSWGVDGLRLDVADEVSHAFWRRLRSAVKEAYPEALLIGEVWHENGMYLGGDEFDGVMNYKLQKVFADYFAADMLTASEAAERINRIVMKNRRQTNAMMLNFLDNHDTPRFLRECGEDESKLRAALLALYFSAGMPCVLYGTELPLTGGGDPDCRRTYDWSQRPRHGEYLKSLSLMRRALPRGEFYAAVEQGVLVLVREDEKERAKAYFGAAESAGEVLFAYENMKVVKERI